MIKPVMVLGLLCACALTACNQAKSPDQVAKDTATARQAAADNDAKAQQAADESLASAGSSLRDEQKDVAHTGAVEGEKIADTEAEGTHKVALAQCERMSGDARKLCKDRADAAYQTAEAQAKQNRVNSDPKP